MKHHLPLFLLGAFAIFIAGASTAHAVNVINLTGYWQDDNGNFIEIQRNGPDAIAIMRSEQGRSNWMRGTMDLSGSEIFLEKKRGTRNVGQVRGEFVNGFGGPRIRWNSGRVWKKSTQSDYNASCRHEGHSHFGGSGFGATAVTLAQLGGRWQTDDQTVIQVVQDGHSISVRVVSRQSSSRPRNPWTSGHGRISDQRLSLDCYHGTALAERVTGVYVPGSRGEAHITWSNGKTWHRHPDNFRVITEPVTTVGRLPGNVIGTVIPSRATSTWQYNDGGYFHRSGDGRWSEYSQEGQIRHRYRETQRTDLSVTLYDDRRGVSVYLKKDECWRRERGSDDWRRLSQGRWSSGPPSSTRPPSVHKGHSHGRYGHPSSSRHSNGLPHRQQSGESVQIDIGIGRILQGLFGN